MVTICLVYFRKNDFAEIYACLPCVFALFSTRTLAERVASSQGGVVANVRCLINEMIRPRVSITR